jgi:hypothetical protein
MLPKSRRKRIPSKSVETEPTAILKPPRKPRARKGLQTAAQNMHNTSTPSACVEDGETCCNVQSKRHVCKQRASRKVVAPLPLAAFDLNIPADPMEVDSIMPLKPARKQRVPRKIASTSTLPPFSFDLNVAPDPEDVVDVMPPKSMRKPRVTKKMQSVSATLVQDDVFIPKKQVRKPRGAAKTKGATQPRVHNTDIDNDITSLMSKLSTFAVEKPLLPDLNVDPQVLKTDNVPKARRDSRKKWGDSIKRGCKASFTIKSLYHLPDVTEICVIHRRHKNESGLVVHGDLKVGDRSDVDAHLSPEMRDKIQGWIRQKYTVAQIMDKHLEDLQERIQKGTLEVDRDIFLEEQDIQNLANGIYGETWRLHKNDAASVRMWTQRNPQDWFYYKQTTIEEVLGPLTGDNMPFTLGIQTPWQKEMMLKYGHGGGISMDATFGTNVKKVGILPCLMLCYVQCYETNVKFTCTIYYLNMIVSGVLNVQFPLYTIMVFDEYHNGIPVAFIITSKTGQADLVPWLKALNSAMTSKQPNWCPCAFIVDCAPGEINSITYGSFNHICLIIACIFFILIT